MSVLFPNSLKGWLADHPFVKKVTNFVSGDDKTLVDWVNKARELHNFLANGTIPQSLRAECNTILQKYKGEIDLIEKGLAMYSSIQGRRSTNADGTFLQHEHPRQLLDLVRTKCGNPAAAALGGSKGVQAHNYMHAYVSSVGSAR